MGNNAELTKLIEQAACNITIAGAGDVSELESLQGVLDQIKQNVSDVSGGPADILEAAKDTSAEAIEGIEKILQEEVKDSTEAIEGISQAVSALQGLIEQIVQVGESEDSVSDETESASEAGGEEEAFVIPEDDVPLVQDFIAEATEHIENAEAGLLDLEGKPGDSEILNQIFRAFHTIKGMAGFLNLTEIGSLAHSAENLLDLARKGELVLAGQNMDVIFESIDMLKKMIASLKLSIESGNAVESQKGLGQLLDTLKARVGHRPAGFRH